MIHFEGHREFPLPIADVFAKLGDAAFIVSCLKDVDEVIAMSADHAEWKLRPGFSFIRGTLDIKMEILERIANTSIKVRLNSRGIGATSTVESTIAFQSKESGTAVDWSADITELTGLLKLVPKGLISSTAGKVIEETWGEIEKKLV